MPRLAGDNAQWPCQNASHCGGHTALLHTAQLCATLLCPALPCFGTGSFGTAHISICRAHSAALLLVRRRQWRHRRKMKQNQLKMFRCTQKRRCDSGLELLWLRRWAQPDHKAPLSVQQCVCVYVCVAWLVARCLPVDCLGDMQGAGAGATPAHSLHGGKVTKSDNNNRSSNSSIFWSQHKRDREKESESERGREAEQWTFFWVSGLHF